MNKKLRLRDTSVVNIIKDISKILGIEYTEEHDEYSIVLTKEFGSGYIKAYEFDFGIGVLEADYILKKNFHFLFEKGLVHPLKIIYNRESSFFHQFEEDKVENEIKHLENIIVSSSPQNNHYFKMPSKNPVCFFSLEINRKLFEEKIEDFLSEMNPDLIDIFRDVNGVNNFFHKSYYSIEIAKFIEEFKECDQTDFMRKVYLEGKVYEILSSQLKEYVDDLNKPQKRTILRKATVERIEEAVSIIKDEMDGLTNIAELSKRVGINQSTLQNGFKQLYKTTVNEFIRNFRIESAKHLLETTDLNITEITYRVGINSRSYFSKLFKKKYGVNPRDFLNQARKKKSA